MLEEEIDLRPYFAALIKNWKWIVGTAVLAAVAAFIVSSLLPPTYKAMALVAVTKPGELVQFDPRFVAVSDTQPLKAYPELATSDQLLQELLPEVTAVAPDIDSLEALRRMAKASSGADPSLLHLTVVYSVPTVAADITNRWAELFVTRANQVFGNQSGDQLAYFENQQMSAAEELNRTEQALIDFQMRNRADIITNQLMALQSTQATYLANQQKLSVLADDVYALREQLNRDSGSDAVTVADQLTALFLQLKAFGADSVTPMQLQVDPAVTLASATRTEQIAFLDGLVETLSARSAAIDAELEMLEPEILDLQQQKQEMVTESNQLTRDYTVAEETYTALARKVEEERITSQDTNSGVRLVSKTAVPREPTRTNRLTITAVAGVLGAIIAVVVITAVYWWQAPKNALSPSTEERTA